MLVPPWCKSVMVGSAGVTPGKTGGAGVFGAKAVDQLCPVLSCRTCDDDVTYTEYNKLCENLVLSTG